MEKQKVYQYFIYDNEVTSDDSPWEAIADFSPLFKTEKQATEYAVDKIKELIAETENYDDDPDFDVEQAYLNSDRFSYRIFEWEVPTND